MCGFWIHLPLKTFHQISLASIPYSLLTSFILPVAGCHNMCILASTHKLAIYGRLLGSLHFRECYFLDALHMQVNIMVLADSFTFRVNTPVAAHTLVTCTLNSLMSLLFDAR